VVVVWRQAAEVFDRHGLTHVPAVAPAAIVAVPNFLWRSGAKLQVHAVAMKLGRPRPVDARGRLRVAGNRLGDDERGKRESSHADWMDEQDGGLSGRFERSG
jgi:hypothetical protein